MNASLLDVSFRFQMHAGLERILGHGQRLVQQHPACGRERDQLLSECTKMIGALVRYQSALQRLEVDQPGSGRRAA